jgi:hypothetical protein
MRFLIVAIVAVGGALMLAAPALGEPSDTGESAQSVIEDLKAEGYNVVINWLTGYDTVPLSLCTSINQINASPPLPPLKVAVLIGDSPEPVDVLPTDYTADFQNAVFEALRKAAAQFAASVPGARLSTVPNTTHYVQTQRPDVVIDAIRGVMS